MALSFKYNKSALYELGEQLKIREKALPTLKSKESALRMEIKRLKKIAVEYEEKLSFRKEEVKNLARLWVEFEEGLVSIKSAIYKKKAIAGVKIPVLDTFEFEVREISQYHKPDWFLDGIHILKELTELSLLREVSHRATHILELARKKTTQKVNLYEKVQIPEYQEAIRKIKRFLEDEENLSKAAQKILKQRKEKQVAL
ncbi:MAG: V-type ATP synthase subunit D [Cyclobacteriaceae bacterium]|nr:V-type ATP synthase subunit D [Cyclobacteriaceae bacterium]UYN85226.1 MAG: V-type ATP synthase subunit D [Cyclobacteriaceae bacterium]